ncbi:hypothetical protein [Lysinibacillus agricola]|uniref:hypothetical protein n=1 Tax=Lysinibacillus agricola TaxID=2590012 RepID=UPI003C1B12F9
MKVGIQQLLPDLIPTLTIPVWELDFNSIDLQKAGIYVFWDKKSANDPNRHHFEYQNLPLYIGKAAKTSNSDLRYGVGSRLYDHYHKDKQKFVNYAYFIDVYIFDDILAGKIDDPIKKMAYDFWENNRDHQDLMPLEQLPLSAYFKHRCEFNADALSHIYEPYMIARRIPIFNKQSNPYVANSKKDKIIMSEDYLRDNDSLHWTIWYDELEPEQKGSFDKSIFNCLKKLEKV